MEANLARVKGQSKRGRSSHIAACFASRHTSQCTMKYNAKSPVFPWNFPSPMCWPKTWINLGMTHHTWPSRNMTSSWFRMTQSCKTNMIVEVTLPCAIHQLYFLRFVTLGFQTPCGGIWTPTTYPKAGIWKTRVSLGTKALRHMSFLDLKSTLLVLSKFLSAVVNSETHFPQNFGSRKPTHHSSRVDPHIYKHDICEVSDLQLNL